MASDTTSQSQSCFLSGLNLIILVVMGFFYIATPSAFGKKESEAWYQQLWCQSLNGVAEFKLDDGTRIDCLTPEYAIEMDFARKWSEAIGQALHYARKTEKKAGIVLILKSAGDKAYLLRLQKIIDHFQLPVKVWQLGPWE